uniref:Neurocan b n=1 Tax=Lates calcarifer TaxID=8187 RepID=A0A4W6E6U9_LATCA
QKSCHINLKGDLTLFLVNLFFFAKGDVIKVNKAFSGRVMLPGYTANPLNATMEISSLRTNDSGTYHCQVVMGNDYERDTVPLVVSGVVFHYQAPSARYALSFTDAQRACQENSAQIATPAQLWAAYYDGFASCATGWLDDQTVRYSVQLPELGCYGHKEYSAGVRNYGKRDPKELFDVYCFAKELDGEVFHSSVPGRLSLSSASDRCVSLGGQLATVGQLYLAWRAGLDSCAPGWLSDGSVRYPVTWPRPDCGGSQPGVRTVTPNSTADNTTVLYDAYCYRDEGSGEITGAEAKGEIQVSRRPVGTSKPRERSRERSRERGHRKGQSTASTATTTTASPVEPTVVTTTVSESADFSTSKSLSALPAETPSPSVLADTYQTLSSSPSTSPSTSPSPSVSVFTSFPQSSPSQPLFESQSPSPSPSLSSSTSPSPTISSPSSTSQTPSLSHSQSSPSSYSPSQTVGSGEPSSSPHSDNQDSSTNPPTSSRWVPVEEAGLNSSRDYPPILSLHPDEEEPTWSHAVALLVSVLERPHCFFLLLLLYKQHPFSRKHPFSSNRNEICNTSVLTASLLPTDVDDCQSEPCENGGTCVDKIDSFLCLCLPSYGGDTCEKDVEGCEHGWRKFHGHCYRYFTHRHTWEDAEKDCREHSAHLSSVISAAEQEFINGLGHDNAWIGLNDRTVEEDFQWTDGNDLVYENWRESQPDNFFAGGEDCVVTIAHEDGKWNDVPCNYNLPYICKKGTVLCGTPPTVENAHLIGRRRSHYDIHSVVRYQCSEGFYQRHIPTARCRADGSWERPRIICTNRRPRVSLSSAKNINPRLQWAQAHQNWTDEDWNNVAWSDESGFLLRHTDGRVRTWHRQHESMDSQSASCQQSRLLPVV